MKATHVGLSIIGAAVKTGKVECTSRIVAPTDAQRWLKDSLWSKQRPYRDWHGEELAETMRKNEFVQGTQIHFVRLHGVIHLVNGQHTLNAIIKFGKPVTLSVLTSEVETEEQIAAIYAGEDQHMRRTLSDAYGAHDLCAKFGLSMTQVNHVGSGIKTIINGFSDNRGRKTYESRSSGARLRLFDEYGTAGVEFLKCVKGAPYAPAKELRVAAIVGVALQTFKDSPVKAGEFWSQVAFGDGVKVGDPRKTLMDWLTANPVKRTPAAARARIAARAWNVFLAGGTATRFIMPDWTKPIVINVA